jgi:hypothetical protein
MGHYSITSSENQSDQRKRGGAMSTRQQNHDPSVVQSLTINASLRALALEMATASNVSLSALVRSALREYAVKRGYLVPAHRDVAS